MSELSTTELLRRVARRDEQAFSVLVARHQAVLLRTARGLLGPGGPFEDVVQESLWTLVRKPPRLSDEDPERQHATLGRWLLQVTRNHCMDWLRRERRRRQREQISAVPEATSGGLEVVEARDENEHVEKLLFQLPDDQREVLVLRICAGKSYRDIAELTGRKVGTVGWLISAGLKRLSDLMGPSGKAEPGVAADTAGRV